MFHYFLFSYLLIISLAVPVFATELDWPKDSELSSLPQYCQAKLRNTSDVAAWSVKLGPGGYGHAHHYCNGLNKINRYYKATSQYDQRFYLGEAVGEFGYMINQAAPTFSLMPEVYLNRGFALSKLHKEGEAMKDFQKAIELNPRLPKAYTMMADVYVKINLKGKALETITEGLRNQPSSKMLQRRYVELGGKEPFPEPYEKATSNAPSSTEKAEKALPAQSKKDADNTAKSTSDNTEPQPHTQQNQPEQPIGMPGNPWCRFCTDSDSKPQ